MKGTWALLQAALAYRDTCNTAARDKFRFVHISTDEVYGSLGSVGSFTEASPYRPELTLFSQQGGLRPPRARLVCNVSAAGDRDQLFE